MTPTEKRCTGCGETKLLDDYGRHKNGKYGRNSKCKECSNARNRARWAADPEGNREYMRKYMKEWNERNPAYRSDRIHYKWEGSYRERVRRFGFEPVVESFTKEELIAEYGDGCWHCEEAPFEELDHYPVPVREGGPHRLSNVRPSCVRCNRPGRGPSRHSTFTAGKSQAKSAR